MEFFDSFENTELAYPLLLFNSMICFLLMSVVSIIIFGSMLANDFLFSLIYHYIGYSTGGYGSGGVIAGSLSSLLFYEIPILLKTNFLSFLLGFGMGADPIGGEVHFLGTHLIRWGVFGFFIYWIIV